MEEPCRRIDSQEIDASIDLVGLNNLIVKMRSSVKKAKVQVIHKLCRTMKQLKNKKGTDDQVTKNKNKADRLYEEVTLIKDLPVDKVSKFSLANTATFDEVCKNPKVSIETRAMTRLACCQAMQKDVATFRKDHEDWESLAKFLIYKQTGRRYKKTRTKGAGSQAMKEMVVKQHGGSTGLGNAAGQKGDVDAEDDGSAEGTDEGSSDGEGSSNEKSDEENNSGIDVGTRSIDVETKKVAENDSKSIESKCENEELSENEDVSENEDSDETDKEVTSVNQEQSKIVEVPHVLNAADKTGEKSADLQTENDEKQTINVYNQRLKHLKIFTVKEDGEELSDEDDSSSEDFAKVDQSSPKNVESESGGSNSESEFQSGSEAEGTEGQASDTNESSSDVEKVSDSSASPRITGDKKLVAGVAKEESVAKDVKKTELIGVLSGKPEVDSKHSSESPLTKTQERSKPELKKRNVKKAVSPKKKELVMSAIAEKSQVEKDVVKPKKEPVNVKKGTMVIQKLNLDAGDVDDIAVSGGDDDSEEEDVPDFLLGSSEERREKREARDMFFITGDGEGDERDVSEGDDGDGDSSGVEEEDAEMTHHRGRQMIESVFVGALSKPESDKSDRNEGYRNFRGGRGRGGRDSFDPNEGQRGYHGDSYQGRGGPFQDRGRRGSYHDHDGYRGSFQGRGGNRGSFQGGDGGRGGFRGHRGGDRGSSMARGGGRFQQADRGSRGDRYNKPYENKTYEHQSKKADDKSSKAAEKVHPSWEASRKRKEQAASIKSFQGKKIKFDDSD